jgi:hypothetical protein
MALHRVHSFSLIAIKKSATSKLALGAVSFVALAIIGTSSVAGAMSPSISKPTKAECTAAGFTNYGQCVKEWAHHKNNGGHGYGGNSVQTNVNVNMGSSHNNIVFVIINYFFG